MFDSAEAIMFPIKAISLFMEGSNPWHYVYDIHPSPPQQQPAAMRQREERVKAFLG